MSKNKNIQYIHRYKPSQISGLLVDLLSSHYREGKRGTSSVPKRINFPKEACQFFFYDFIVLIYKIYSIYIYGIQTTSDKWATGGSAE